MSNDIRNIIERLAILEGRITPTTVKSGLNPEQKAAKQLPALFKPKNISPTLSKKPYQKHPMDGWLVGEGKVCETCHCDPCECNEETLEEAMANEEKLLDKVRDSLKDYLASVEKKYHDDSISKKADDKDLGKRAKDKDLVAKEIKVVDEDPTQEEPANTDVDPTLPVQDPTYSASANAPIKTITMEDGRMCEIHGDEHTGFEIRHGNRSLRSRFKNIDQAEMALEMYLARCRANDSTADYLEEK